MIPKSCRLFGQDHATEQIGRAKSRFNLNGFRSRYEGAPQSAASCDEIAMVQYRFERLLQAWLVPRCTTVSPAASGTSAVSSTSVISPSRIRQKSSVRVFCI